MEIQNRYREILTGQHELYARDVTSDYKAMDNYDFLNTQSTCSVTHCPHDYTPRGCDSLGSMSNNWIDLRSSKSVLSCRSSKSSHSVESFVCFGGEDTEQSHITFGSDMNLAENDMNMSKIKSSSSVNSKCPRGNTVNVSKTRKVLRNSNCCKTVVLRSKKNNENNNFMKDRRGKFTEAGRAQSWRDENVFDRIETLSKPKKDFSIEANENDNNEDCERKTYDEERIAALAQPKPKGGEWCGRADKDNRWECTYPFESKYCRENQIAADLVDWDRLAHCRVPYQSPDRENFAVSRAALNAVATRRLEKLSVPRKIVDSDEYYLWLLNKKPDTDAKLKPIKRLSIHKIDLKGERVFIRCDLDHTKTPPPLEQKIDQIRLTTQYALNRGAKAVVIASHCGKPKGRSDGQFSLKNASVMLSTALQKEVVFLDDCIGPEAQALCEDPEPGSVFVLENLRYYPQEEGFRLNERGKKVACTKDEIQAFRAKLFALGDIFIHDDFSSLVEMSNTTIGSQKQERGYGWNIFFELSKYNTFVTRPLQPMVAVIGGNFNDKIDMVHNIMGKAQEVLLGGEIAHIFLKTLKGIDIGTTASCPNKEKKVLNAMSRAKDIKCVVSLPSDVVVRNTKKPNEYFTVSTKLDVEPWFEMVDIGKVTRECYINALKNAKSIVWSGDMGVLLDGTMEIGQVINDVTVENQTNTFIMDEETETTFKNLIKDGRVTAVTGDGRVTSLLLKNKIPKGLQALSPYRKNIKKRQAKVEPVSFKPYEITKPGYRIETGFNKLCVDQVDVDDKIVMIECDLTAPVIQGRVIDHYALRMVVPTVKWVLKRGARCVVLCSPIMARDSRMRQETSLRPMAQEMERLLKRRVMFVPYTSGKKVQDTIEYAYDGSVIMLENILDDPEENFTFKMEPLPGAGRRRSPESVAAYCEMLSKQCDVWVNDAFSLLNRDSSAMTGCMHKVRPCGFLIKNELKYLSKTFNKPMRKFLAIIGGHQVHKQIEIMRGMVRDVDEMIITGMLGLHCLWVLQGMKLGLNFDRSITKSDIQALIDMATNNRVRLYFPVDMLTTNDLDSGRNSTTLSTSDGIGAGRYFADIGPKTISLFSRIIKRSRLVLWVGVVGLCTHEEFRKGTRSILDTIVECTLSQEINQISIIGGEFLTKYVHALNRNHEGISHITTGPDVMLTLLSDRNAVALDTLSYNSQARLKCINRLHIDLVEIKDKRVLLRADFRAPGPKSAVGEDQEPMRHLVGVIKNLLKRGAFCITLCGHLGNPIGHRDETLTLLPIKTSLEKHLKKDITFFNDGLTDLLEASLKTPEHGKIYMLENMRFNPAEIGRGMNNNEQIINSSYEEMDAYRARLASLGDVFVNESMEGLHTTDASVAGVQIETRVAGMTLKAELAAFAKLIPKMEKPVLAIVGGDDVYDKTMLLYDIIDIADEIIIAGRVALNFLRTTKGMTIGKDPVDKNAVKIVHRVLSKAAVQDVKVQFPVDFAVLIPADPTDEEPEDSLDIFTVAQGIPDSQKVVDIGEESMDTFTAMIAEAKTILYTGSIGQCSIELGSLGTRAILDAMSTQTTENGAVTIAFGTHGGNMCMNSLEEAAGLSHISRGRRTVVDLILGRPLPGLEHLNLPQLKPLPWLTMQQMNIKGKKVLLRLDLDLPTVDGVVLDNDKIEDSLETIRYILDKEPSCLIMAGFRGNPNGYRNNYLSMKPLILEFEYFLETTVQFLDEPCSRKARMFCEDPAPGSVFLMENLKFYPAELGQEEEMPDILTEEPEPVVVTPKRPSKTNLQTKSRSQFNLNQIGMEGGENIDKVMYELMPFKTVEQYTREIADCCDVFINDDVTHIWENLTSNTGFDLNEKACGNRVKELLQYSDDLTELRKAPAVEALSPATKEQLAM